MLERCMRGCSGSLSGESRGPEVVFWEVLGGKRGCGCSAGRHLGFILESKREPNRDKIATKFASKSRVDLEEHFGAKKEPNGTPEGAQMKVKWNQNRFKK